MTQAPGTCQVCGHEVTSYSTRFVERFDFDAPVRLVADPCPLSEAQPCGHEQPQPIRWDLSHVYPRT